MLWKKKKSEQELAEEIRESNARNRAKIKALQDMNDLQSEMIVDLYQQNQDLKIQVNNYKLDHQDSVLDSPFIGLMHIERTKKAHLTE